MATLGFDAAKVRTGDGKKPLMILTDGEHPSVENPAKLLEARGWKVVRIPTTGGELDLSALREAVSEKCTCLLASFMLVNNETGAMYDVKRAASIVRAACPDAHIHCDAVQAFLKVKFSPQTLGVDTLTVSAHKIHAPRGAAALYISPETVKKKNIAPVIPGGGQESGYRSGTENLVSIAAFAAAAEEGKAHLTEHMERVRVLREYLDSRLCELNPLGIVAKPVKGAIPDIVNLTLPRIKSETMLNFLSGKGICVSAGSACSAGSGRLSHALRAFGTTDDEIDSSVRVSLSHTNTEADIDALCTALAQGAKTLQKF
ncbi:MAG: aminotransferase class V-fold PLP-dependent enzyme [Clostridia bacterium]|nr:aminotransferase class V-fold PLP-dependent enzyme [Clostridia bacterium]